MCASAPPSSVRRRLPTWRVLAVACAAATWAPRSVTALPARVQGRQLLVDGKPIHLKGVCWNPVRKGGVHPRDLDFRGFVSSDAEFMAKAGVNVIRTYEAIVDRDVLDVLWSKRIFVFNTVYVWGGDPVSAVVDRVKRVQDHPAILAWAIGNEWNYNGLYLSLPFPVARQRVKEACDLIKTIDTEHPVATIHGETPSPETLQFLHNIDIWGINRYSGIDFGTLFEHWSTISDAPMFLGEYGADAFDARHDAEDEEAQAKATGVLTKQVVQASSVTHPGVCIGGFIFEFADELWKDGSGDPHKHNKGGVSPGGGPYPDFTFNEEWWGLVKWDGTPRKAFWEYASVETPGMARTAASKILRGGGRAQIQSALGPLRKQVCGAFPACKGKLGFCCPNERGIWDACCTVSAPTQPTTVPPEQTTTWLVPASLIPSRSCSGPYEEKLGVFVAGKFEADQLGCPGTSECQFLNLTSAQAFCSQHPSCTAVLLHPYEDDCAGGLGCYTARRGPPVANKEVGERWNSNGGRAWVRTKGHCTATLATPSAPIISATPQVSSLSANYVFMGRFKAPEAQKVCEGVGRLAMPKTAAKRQELLSVVQGAKAAGKFSDTWPNNTLWLGGQFNPTAKQWMWNDGTPIGDVSWAEGQPSAARTNQMGEPWMCMLLNGDVHDAESIYKFGVICELGEGAAPAQSAVVPTPPPKELVPPAPPTPPPPTTTPIKPWLDEDGVKLVHYKDLSFAGFHALAASQACGPGRRLVMPKGKAAWRQLTEAMRSAMDDGRLSASFPENTIWLGGHWCISSKRWEWDDGTRADGLPWARDQPGAHNGHQAEQPLLCARFTDGDLQVHDCPPQGNKFGVMCEKGPALETSRRLSPKVIFE